MINTAYAPITESASLPKRILANLKVQISWVDSRSGETISVFGTTEHIRETGALVNMDVFPAVGSNVRLRLYDEDKTIIETLTEVIRIERDPGKPLIALSVIKNFKSWQETALMAAHEWVIRHWKINYEEEWAN